MEQQSSVGRVHYRPVICIKFYEQWLILSFNRLIDFTIWISHDSNKAVNLENLMSNSDDLLFVSTLLDLERDIRSGSMAWYNTEANELKFKYIVAECLPFPTVR